MPGERLISAFVSIAAALLLFWSTDSHAQPYVVGSSPSLSKQASESIFEPLASLLSAATGERFTYRYTSNWPSYIQAMRQSEFDLVFEEPHLISWRVENLQHVPLVKLSGALSFVVITRNDDDTVIQLRDLAGHTVCADAPPAIDGLVLFAQFENPSRQPVLRRVRDPAAAYAGILEARCRGAVLPSRQYVQLSGDSTGTRILFLSESFPNWALSVDPRLPAEVRDRIRQVLLDPDNDAVTRPLGNAWGGGYELRPAYQTDYVGYTDLLQDFWGLQ